MNSRATVHFKLEVASLMADSLPPVLLEACVVVGASEDKLGEICQVSSDWSSTTGLNTKSLAVNRSLF